MNGQARAELPCVSRWLEASPGIRRKGGPLPSEGAPEVAELTFSFLPLTDAASFIIAHTKGWFREFGIQSMLRRETSWTGLRDALNSGAAQAAQILFSMPLSAACGLLGAHQKPLIVPWILNRNGQAITLNKMYAGKVASDSRSLLRSAIEARNRGRPLVFGHTLRVGTHALWLRYWLAAGGIHPDNDVALITVPPPQMAANMRTARMDGFCVGEPWNARALAEGLGYTAITTQEIWPDHPEKACAFTREFAEQNPRSVTAALKALHLAGVWLDDPANLDEAAQILGQPDHLGCEPALIRSRLGNAIDYGDGRSRQLPNKLIFSGQGSNRPSVNHAIWFLTQLRRWGLHFAVPDYAGVSARVIRQDFHTQALRELGVLDVAYDEASVMLFDGKVFNPSAPEEYAQSFELKNILG
jgi:nitrate/nitrite transport system substrate-binding protein